MAPTFKSLITAAEKAGNAAAVAILIDAETNANETVWLEKAAPESEWERIALASIACTGAFEADRKARAWFKRRGYEW